MSLLQTKTQDSGPLEALEAPQTSATSSPVLSLQGLIGNAGVLDLLWPQMSPGLPATCSAEVQGAPPSPAQRAADPVAERPEREAGSAEAPASEPSSWWDDAVDWTVGGVGGLVDAGTNLLSDVPALGSAAATTAPLTKFTWETLGGFAKGAGDMVGGIANMVAHPIDTASGLGSLLEHVPGSPLKPLHKLYDVAAGNKTFEDTFWRNPLEVASDDLGEDWAFWKKVGGALAEPYQRSIEQGRYGEAIGRGVFDVGSLLVGAGEAKALGEGAEAVSVLNKVDDTVKLASKAEELGAVADDISRVGNKADDVTKASTHVDEAADLSKVDDSAKLAEGSDEVAEVAKRAEEPGATVQARSGGRSPTPEDYKRIETKADVPEHYSSDTRFDDLSADPDHAGKVTDKSVKEAMTGLEAERQGLVKAPIERGPKGIEFYDGSGAPYDVKTPPSPAAGAPFRFKPKQSGASILDQVRKKAGNRVTGQEEFVKVLLDTSYMTADDLGSLREFLLRSASPEELARIIELNVSL